MTHAWLDQAGHYFQTDHDVYPQEWPDQVNEEGNPLPKPPGRPWPMKVPNRPSQWHTWTGSEWIEDAAAAAAAAAELASARALAKLADIDAASIRSIREYLSAKPDAPQRLKDYEAEAAAERVKVRK